MKPPIFTPEARADLRSVTRDSLVLFGVRQAKTYFDRLTKASIDLAAGRRIGRPLDNRQPEHFRLNVGAHALIYRVRGDGRVVILRILHSRMDIPSHL